MLKIRNPVIRYTCKYLANTLFARKDSNAVRSIELNLLFQGLKHLVVDNNGDKLEDSLGDDVNLGCIFATELMSYRKWASTTNDTHCYVGGTLTWIFQLVDVDLEYLHQVASTKKLDYYYLVRCKFLKDNEDEDTFIFQYTNIAKEPATLLLPCIELTSIAIQGNIHFPHIGEPYPLPLPPQEAPPTPPPSPPLDPWSLPPLKLKPKNKGERIFYEAYKAQQKVNKWAKKMFEKLHRKIKRTPGYETSGEEVAVSDEEGSVGGEHQSIDEEIDEGMRAANEVNFQPSRHSMHMGEASSQYFEANTLPTRHSIHEMPSSSFQLHENYDEEDDENTLASFLQRRKKAPKINR